MLSYKKWKLLNENLDYPLGVKSAKSLAEGPMGMVCKRMAASPGMDMGGDDSEMPMPPMKKKKPMMGKSLFGKGPMGGGMGGEEEELDIDVDDEGDGEEAELDIDADAEGDEEMGDEEGGDLGDMGDEEDMGGEGDEEMGDMGIGGDEEDIDVTDKVTDDMGDEEETETDMDMPAPPFKKGSLTHKTKELAAGAKMMHQGAMKMKKCMKESAGCGKSCKCKKCAKKQMMSHEENEFFKSLQSQAGGTKFAIGDLGVWSTVQEDALIPPTNPNNAVTQNEEPAAGDYGFAPVSKIGAIGSFQEWSNKHKTAKPKTKKKK